MHVATTERQVLPPLERNHELTNAAAILKDTVYIDGGYLSWIPGMKDGSYGSATQDSKLMADYLLRAWPS